MKILNTIGCAIIIVSFIISCPAAHANSVKNKTYTVWVSSSFDDSPFPPFQDCFQFTKDQLCIAGCSGECGRLSEVPSLGVWEARVSCGGLDLRFKGTSLTEPATSVIAATGAGVAEGTNFAVEGIKDTCSLAASRSAGSRYKR